MLHAFVTCPSRSWAWVHEGMAALPHGNGTFLEWWVMQAVAKGENRVGGNDLLDQLE